MPSLKENIPDIATLKRRIIELSQSGIDNFLTQTKPERDLAIKSRLYFFVSIILLIVSFLIAPLLSFPLAAIIIIALALVAGFYGYSWNKAQNILAQKHNLALVPIISACLGSSVSYSHDDGKDGEAKTILVDSELLTNFYDKVSVDDVYRFENDKISVRELSVTTQVRTDKNTHTVTIFNGLLVKVIMGNPLEGSTYISTEGDKSGFAHKNFMSELFSTSKVRETQLEWNEFEQDLHVATDNEVEARYILTPSFMEDLHRWWSVSRENIRIVFKGNQMTMLLPNTNIKFSTSTTSVDANELNKYALTVIEPLWRTLTLTEDIRV